MTPTEQVQTRSTLEFASRAKTITQHASVNEVNISVFPKSLFISGNIVSQVAPVKSLLKQVLACFVVTLYVSVAMFGSLVKN